MLFWNCVWSGAELRALSTAQHAEIFKEFFQNILSFATKSVEKLRHLWLLQMFYIISLLALEMVQVQVPLHVVFNLENVILPRDFRPSCLIHLMCFYCHHHQCLVWFNNLQAPDMYEIPIITSLWCSMLA